MHQKHHFSELIQTIFQYLKGKMVTLTPILFSNSEKRLKK